MRISRADWGRYVSTLGKINQKAANAMALFMSTNPEASIDEVINQAQALTDRYGEAAASLACEMYDALAQASGVSVPPAVPAQVSSPNNTAKAIQGTMKNQNNTVPETVGRLVKQAGADTTMQNAQRDKAQFAWIPYGNETCAFCIMLASRGWQNISRTTLRYGHAEHIHANCQCQYAVRFTEDTEVDGYDPGTYREIYENAPGDDWQEKLNAIRRGQYAEETEEDTPAWNGDKLRKVLGADLFDPFADKVNASVNKKLFDKFSEEATYKFDNGGYYSPGADAVHFGMENHPGMDKFSTLAHESGHMFDAHLGKADGLSFSEVDLINQKCKIGSGQIKTVQYLPSSSDEFLSALRADMQNLRPKVANRTIRAEFLATTEMRNATSGVQDALDGFYSTKSDILPWGHGDRYYNRFYNKRIVGFGNEQALKEAFEELGFDASNQTKTKRIARQYEAASEAWANVSSAVTCGGQELEAIEKYMPETLKAYLQIVEGIK